MLPQLGSLVALATQLDERGMSNYADELDLLIARAALTEEEWLEQEMAKIDFEKEMAKVKRIQQAHEEGKLERLRDAEDEPVVVMERLTQVPEDFEVLSPIEENDDDDIISTNEDPEEAVQNKLEQAEPGTIQKVMDFLRTHPDLLARLLVLLV